MQYDKLTVAARFLTIAPALICYSVAISLESGCLAGITTLPPSPIVRSLCPFTAGGHGVVDPKF